MNFLKHVIDSISNKDGIGNWSYNLEFMVVLMMLVMMFIT